MADNNYTNHEDKLEREANRQWRRNAAARIEFLEQKLKESGKSKPSAKDPQPSNSKDRSKS